ncbi:MAG: hypothetical protein QXO96_05975 [Sulfolobales archaeon]
MEVRKYTDIVGAVATENIVEGRMVLMVPQSTSHNFGSREDLPGFKLPANSTEAARAKFVSAFALDNRPLPLIDNIPAYEWSLRMGGWDRVRNMPFTATLRMVYPANDYEPQTIASGSLMLGFDRGVFTVTSGHFIYNSNLAPGAYLAVANATDDGSANAGKLKYSASASFAVVEQFDADNMVLTFRTL